MKTLTSRSIIRLRRYSNALHRTGLSQKFLRSDNGPEFVARAVCQWLETSGCQTLFIRLGSPWENGYIESFFDKLRDECLNCEVFRNGRGAQAIVEKLEAGIQYLPSAQLAGLPDSSRVCPKILRNQAGRRGWTIKGKGRDSLIIGGTKIGGTPYTLV